MKNKKYHFTPEIERELQLFKKHLASQGFDSNTIRQNGNYTGVYLTWLKGQGMEKISARYQDIIAFIHYLQKQNYPPRFINCMVLAVRHYYYYLSLPKNPAAGIHLRGVVSRVPRHIVDYEEIVSVYERYPCLDLRTKRNKVILGLLVYQAITTAELHRLEPGHVKLKEAKIYIPGKLPGTSRLLPLQAGQLLSLQEYIHFIRPQLQQVMKTKKLGRGKKVHWDAVQYQLFFGTYGSNDIKNGLHQMFKTIRQMNPKITSGAVIRYSVIAEWLKTKNVREVQYLAGHKSIHSTERYRSYHLEELKDALNNYHPLK